MAFAVKEDGGIKSDLGTDRGEKRRNDDETRRFDTVKCGWLLDYRRVQIALIRLPSRAKRKKTTDHGSSKHRREKIRPKKWLPPLVRSVAVGVSTALLCSGEISA